MILIIDETKNKLVGYRLILYLIIYVTDKNNIFKNSKTDISRTII